MASKYDFYWRSRLKDLSTLLDKAFRDCRGYSLDVSGIKKLGDRGNWQGVVDVCRNRAGKGEMVHAKSLGNVIIESKLLKDYGDSQFRLTISSDCTLTAVKSSGSKSIQPRLVESNSRQVNFTDNKIVCFIPCCKSKNATGEIYNPSQELSVEHLPHTFSHLLSGRDSMEFFIDKDSRMTTALNLYSGHFYRALSKNRIIEKITMGELSLFIISAGYGVINALEPIYDYDALLSGKVARQWRENRLGEVIADYLVNQKPTEVYGFFAGEECWSGSSSNYRFFFTEGVRKAINNGLDAKAGCFYREDGLGAGSILYALGYVFNEFANLGFNQAYVQQMKNEVKVIGNVSVGFKKIEKLGSR